MSYDLYAYRPGTSAPDPQDAQQAVEASNDAQEGDEPLEPLTELSERIASELTQHDSGLQRFAFDFDEIARLENTSTEQARKRCQWIELNAPEGELSIQLTIYADQVCLTIPYWYAGENADLVFAKASGHLRIIRKVAGYYSYDPQTNVAFDPLTTDMACSSEYDRIVRNLPAIVNRSASRSSKRWWKFW